MILRRQASTVQGSEREGVKKRKIPAAGNERSPSLLTSHKLDKKLALYYFT